MSVEVHLESAAAFIAVAESGDSERVAYEHAADEILAAQKEDPTLSFREVDRQLGRGNNYSGKLVRWRTSGADRLPFSEGGGPSGDRNDRGARKVLRDPTRRQQVFESLEPEERTEIIRAAIKANPEVRAAVEADVETEQAERKFQTEQRRTRNAGMPLSAYFHRLIGAIRKTGRDLDFIRGELAELTADERPKVDEALVELIAKAEACRLELNPELKRTGIDEHAIIEGTEA